MICAREQLHLFLFPSSLEHPEATVNLKCQEFWSCAVLTPSLQSILFIGQSTGRLELFARYGPVDQALVFLADSYW